MVPMVTDATPEYQKKPFAYFKPSIPKGNNVWIDTNNVVSEIQPALWVAQTFYRDDGSVSSSMPGVKRVFYGGHSYTLNSQEVQLLTQNGYAPYITFNGGYGQSTYGGSDQYA